MPSHPWRGRSSDVAIRASRRIVEWLLAHKVLLPGVTVLERFVGRVRDRAQRQLWRKLIEGLSAEQRHRIDQMFTNKDPDTIRRKVTIRALKHAN